MATQISTIRRKSVYLDEALHRRLKVAAARGGKRLEDVTREAFLAYLDREERKTTA